MASLPPQAHPLLGRSTEIDEIRAALLERHMRLLTLTGPGGSGKTRLAVELANALADAFDDGVVFVDLSPLPPGQHELVWVALAERLGLQDLRRDSMLERIGAALDGRRLLLVLDNVEHVLGAAPQLARLFQQIADFQVLATSREPLRLRWERVYPVPPLPAPSATALFEERARAVQPRFELDADGRRAVEELCERLDRLPLAIELAAARTRVLSPQALLSQIGRRATVLAGGPRDSPARHQTLDATIAWSYDLLDDNEQALFRSLALFPGGATPEAAAHSHGVRLDEAEALQQLQLLAEKSLLRVISDEPRFAMLETLRSFGLQRARERDEQTSLVRSQVEYFIDLAERAEGEIPGPNEVAWLDRLELEYANLRSVVHAALAQGLHEQALGLCVKLSLYWRFRAHMDEALRWIEEALRLGVATRRLEASALAIAGRFAWSLGSHTTGSEYVRRSIELWRELGDTRGLANALNEHGLQSGDSGNATEARTAHEESLVLYRSVGDVPGTTQTLHALGFRAEERGELETAGALLEEALALRRSMGHPSGTARTLNGLGIVARGTGDYTRAEALHAESLELYRGLGHELGAAYSLAYLARAAVARGDQSRAVELARESLAIAWQHRNPWVMSLNLGLFGIVYVQQGNAAEGVRLLAVAQRLLGGAEPSSATERAEHATACERARQSLGSQFDAAWRAAEALDVDEVIERTLAQIGAAQAGAPVKGNAKVDARPLSARELEVAQRVARGLTNRQIAEELVISKWTADNHVANILRKLDLATRAQVAGWLAQRGLL